MIDYNFVLETAMTVSEGIAAFTAIIYFKEIKKTPYRYFAFYLILIFCCEIFGLFALNYFSITKNLFFNYFVIPLEFLFFYWLYGCQSLQNKKLFIGFSALFLLAFIPNELYFVKNKHIFSFNYTFGSLLLMFLVIMEYYKQINSENILNFAKNKMFYINLGVTLFYIGTLPFWTFYFQLLSDYREIWDAYLKYFRISGILMYLLFASSFIWGKRSYT